MSPEELRGFLSKKAWQRTSMGRTLCFSCLKFPFIASLAGDDGIRTHDPLLAGQVLSQLSYTPMLVFCGSLPFVRKLQSARIRQDSRALASWLHSAALPYASAVLIPTELHPHVALRGLSLSNELRILIQN